MAPARQPGSGDLVTEKKDQPAMMNDYRAQLSGAVMTAGFKPPLAAEGPAGKDGALSEKARWKAFFGFHGDMKLRISALMDVFRDTCRRFTDSIQRKIAACRSRIENWLKTPGSGKGRGSRV
jgi:hypothetical protein